MTEYTSMSWKLIYTSATDAIGFGTIKPRILPFGQRPVTIDYAANGKPCFLRAYRPALFFIITDEAVES